MSEPHKVSEPKNFRKISFARLTPQDISDIIGEIALSRRFNLEPYQIMALGYAQGAVLQCEEDRKAWLEQEGGGIDGKNTPKEQL